jgi:hypothetical protein
VQLSVLRDKLDPALALYADVVRNPAFPAADLERNRQNTLAQIQQEKVQPFGLALRVLPALLYGAGHAYGTPLTGSGTEAAVRAMTRDQLVAYHRAWFKPNHATLVVVGDVSMADLRPRLERAFAGWAPGDVPAKAIAQVPARTRPEVYLLDRPGAEQSIIMAGQVVAPKANPDEFSIMAFNEAFGGAFTSRINLNLREDKHWSYGAGSFAFDARGQRPWIVYAPVQTDKTRESLAEMAKELREVAAGRPVAGPGAGARPGPADAHPRRAVGDGRRAPGLARRAGGVRAARRLLEHVRPARARRDAGVRVGHARADAAARAARVGGGGRPREGRGGRARARPGGRAAAGRRRAPGRPAGARRDDEHPVARPRPARPRGA